jgi:bacteriocin-like protein
MEGGVMESKHSDRQPRLGKKLTLHKETIRILSDKELAGIEGGAGGTKACTSGNTCACGGTCGNLQSTCVPFP